MSDETAEQARRAVEKFEAAEQKANQLQADCLNAVADGIPSRADGIAKRVAQSQPAVTKSLGIDGIRTMRDELANAAQELANDMRSSGSQIEWPAGEYEYTPVKTHDIHSALFKYMYGARVNRLANVLRRAGFDTYDSDRGGQSLVYPQSLYTENEFAALASALTELGPHGGS